MNPDITDERWYTTEQLAELLGVDPSSVRRWRTARRPSGAAIRQGLCPAHDHAASDVEIWLWTQRVDPGAAA